MNITSFTMSVNSSMSPSSSVIVDCGGSTKDDDTQDGGGSTVARALVGFAGCLHCGGSMELHVDCVDDICAVDGVSQRETMAAGR